MVPAPTTASGHHDLHHVPREKRQRSQTEGVPQVASDGGELCQTAEMDYHDAGD